MRNLEKKCKVYVGFIDLEKAYNKVNRETLWQVLRVYVGVNYWVELRVCMLKILFQSKRGYE